MSLFQLKAHEKIDSEVKNEVLFDLIMLCNNRRHHLVCAQYVPRLSGCVVFVGVLLVFILFRAPLTISEM